MLQERRTIRDTTAQSTTSSVSSSVSVSSEAHLGRKVELVEDYFQDAKKMVQRALKLDEKGERMGALELYNQALSTMQAGLKFLKSTEMMNSSLYELKQKMEKLKSQVKTRMNLLLSEEERSKHSKPEPSTRQPISESEVTTGGGKGGRRESVAAEADILYSASVGVKIIRVSSSGVVSNCTTADSVSIFKYRSKIPGQPPGFLQCGDFVYPLVPGKSPVLRTANRAYMFPDVQSGNDGDSVGLMLDRMPDGETEELSRVLSWMSDVKDSRDNFESVAGGGGHSPAGVREPNTEGPTWGSTISEKIGSGVNWISGMISQGTDKGEDLLSKGGNKIRDNIEPREEPVNVPVPIERGAFYARKASGVVVGVSDFLMTTLAKGTVMVGKKVGSAISESDTMKDVEINPHVVEAWKVTKSTAKGAGRVFSDLEKGARVMIRTSGQEASKTAGHKYGHEVGKVTDDSLVTAGHVVDLTSTYWNWKTWGISFLSKVGKVISDGDRENADNVQTKALSTPPTVRAPSTINSASTMSTVCSSQSPIDKQSRSNRVHKKEKEVEVLYNYN